MHSTFSALLAITACAMLASCASSTMDSIPTEAQMENFKLTARRSLTQEYMSLAEQRQTGILTNDQYNAELAKLEDRVVSFAHSLAWQSHNMAESQRKSMGIPTPDAPVSLGVPNMGASGSGGGASYQSALNNFNSAGGVGGGSSVMPSLSGVGSSMKGLGGSMSRGNYPGSIYDEPKN